MAFLYSDNNDARLYYTWNVKTIMTVYMFVGGQCRQTQFDYILLAFLPWWYPHSSSISIMDNKLVYIDRTNLLWLCLATFFSLCVTAVLCTAQIVDHEINVPFLFPFILSSSSTLSCFFLAFFSFCYSSLLRLWDTSRTLSVLIIAKSEQKV